MAIKKNILLGLVLAVGPFFCYTLQAQNPEVPKAKQGHVMPTSPQAENKAAFPTMPQPGNKISISDGYYFIYSFDKRPKLGPLIIKVEIFTKEGKKETSFEIKADAGMPSMKGAHESGSRAFTLSQKGDYLLPINIVMAGDWEIRLTFSKEGKVIFRGSHQFNV
jgi:hypothetical protein